MLIPGDDIGGFSIVDKITAGGMGTVYRARTQTGTPRAVKVIHPHLLGAASIRRRFLLEARLLETLEHPGIVRFYHIGEAQKDNDTLVFMAMELLNGATLREEISKARPGVDTHWSRAYDGLIPQLLQALCYLHERNVAHRDVKPDNIFLTEEGLVKLLDFGLAFAGGDDFSVITRTVSSPMGTIAYLAPEVLKGDRANGGAQSVLRSALCRDVFALGMTFYEAFTGVHPFQHLMSRDSSEVAVGQLVYHLVHTAIPDIGERRPDLPVGVRDAIMRALSRDPSRRYANAIEMSEDLGQVACTMASAGHGAGNIEFTRGGAAPSRPSMTAACDQPGLSSRAEILSPRSLPAVMCAQDPVGSIVARTGEHLLVSAPRKAPSTDAVRAQAYPAGVAALSGIGKNSFPSDPGRRVNPAVTYFELPQIPTELAGNQRAGGEMASLVPGVGLPHDQRGGGPARRDIWRLAVLMVGGLLLLAGLAVGAHCGLQLYEEFKQQEARVFSISLDADVTELVDPVAVVAGELGLQNAHERPRWKVLLDDGPAVAQALEQRLGALEGALVGRLTRGILSVRFLKMEGEFDLPRGPGQAWPDWTDAAEGQLAKISSAIMTIHRDLGKPGETKPSLKDQAQALMKMMDGGRAACGVSLLECMERLNTRVLELRTNLGSIPTTEGADARPLAEWIPALEREFYGEESEGRGLANRGDTVVRASHAVKRCGASLGAQAGHPLKSKLGAHFQHLEKDFGHSGYRGLCKRMVWLRGIVGSRGCQSCPEL